MLVWSNLFNEEILSSEGNFSKCIRYDLEILDPEC